MKTVLALILVCLTWPAFAQPNRAADPWQREIEVVAISAENIPLMRVKIEFLGHQPPEGYRAFKGDPQKVQHDFYRRTLTNLTNKPLNFVGMTVKTRYGTATVVTQDKATGSESFGSVVNVDIQKSPVVTGNVLLAAANWRSTHFVTGGSLSKQALDITVAVEQDGKQAEVTYQLVYLNR